MLLRVELAAFHTPNQTTINVNLPDLTACPGISATHARNRLNGMAPIFQLCTAMTVRKHFTEPSWCCCDLMLLLQIKCILSLDVDTCMPDAVLTSGSACS